jgi:GDPmannose 4,6-dehydratase
LAGQTSVALSFQQPVEAFESISVSTINILECARLLDHPVRIFNPASSECFGNTEAPADEETPFRPRSPYAMAKAAAFWTVANYREAYGMHACSGILFNHESPLRPERFVTQKIITGVIDIAAGRASKLRLGNLDVQRDWGWAPEYVEAMWLMLQQSEPVDFIIATGRSHELREFVELAFAEAGLNWTDYVEHDESLLRPLDLERSVGNPEKISRILGWRAETGLREIVRQLIEEQKTIDADRK